PLKIAVAQVGLGRHLRGYSRSPVSPPLARNTSACQLSHLRQWQHPPWYFLNSRARSGTTVRVDPRGHPLPCPAARRVDHSPCCAILVHPPCVRIERPFRDRVRSRLRTQEARR